MRYSKFYFTLIILLGAISFSCSDLKQDLTVPSKVSVHGVNLYNPSASTFHGETVKEKTLQSCRQCHSADLTGGTASVNCLTCHPALSIHKAGISDPTAAGFHGKYIASKNWSMSSCTSCHGTNYAGGVASPSCNTCHKNTGGPEACNTCHGNFSDPTMIAPPKDLNNNTDTKFASVGAHSTHLVTAKGGAIAACSACHNVPQSFSSPGHIDNTNRAELVFTKISNNDIGGAAYDFTTYKCANTYCHGGFAFSKSTSSYPFAYTADKIEGNNFQPVWNKVDGSQIACGSCHGLPPKGHMDADLKSCATCHPSVIDKYGKIIDSKKHMDGKIDVF